MEKHTDKTINKINKLKFKKEEWCFCEFKLQQVTETNEDRITSVSDGYFSHPDLNRKLIDMWVEMCENRNNPEKLKELYEKLNDFGQSVVNRVREIRGLLIGNNKGGVNGWTKQVYGKVVEIL